MDDDWNALEGCDAMKICILMGSYRETGNTATLLIPFIQEIERLGGVIENINLSKRQIEPCTACWTCQDVFEEPGCSKHDDMEGIFQSVLSSDCVVFATPIYSWYCTPVLKAVLDRLVYSMNKYYGETEGPCLWEGKPCAVITTCGYEIEYGSGVFEEGIKRYAEHSRLKYIGKLAVRDIDGRPDFKTESAVNAARTFARTVIHGLAPSTHVR